jgi:F0F1-type ATP synthase membrane subunit b/b'
MGVKKQIDDTVANAKDGLDEARHRTAAAAEKTKRDVAGDAMTTSEKAGSVLKQAKESTQAEIDHAKRAVRSNVGGK